MNEDNESIAESTYHKLKPGDKIVGASNDVPYYKVGTGGENHKGQSMNLVQEMSKMTKAELWFFSEIEKKLDFSDKSSIGAVYLSYKKYTDSQNMYV